MPISDIGTPLEDHLFAVFDTPQQADAATSDLAALGVPVHRFEGTEAAGAFEGPETGNGDIMTMVLHVLRGLSEETHESERYARHLRRGRIVLAMPAENRAVAVLLTRLLTRDGAHDVTFYDNLTYEHMTPRSQELPASAPPAPPAGASGPPTTQS